MEPQITTGTYGTFLPTQSHFIQLLKQTDYIKPTAALLEKAMAETSSMHYILTHAPTHDFFALFLRASIMSGARITEINGFKGIGLMLPPNANPSNQWIMLRAGILGVMWKEGWGWWWRLRGVGKADLRGKAIGQGEEAFTVLLVATDERARGKGCASRIMESFQDTARKEGKPIWCKSLIPVVGKLNLVKQKKLMRGSGHYFGVCMSFVRESRV
jgi:hypothetical protein